MLEKLEAVSRQENENTDSGDAPFFKDFVEEWLYENQIRWKQSHIKNVDIILNNYLIEEFGSKKVSHITKGEILKFRSSLAKVRNGKKLSPDRINHIITPLRMILNDAADRYEFNTPFTGIKQLPVRRTDVDPFSLKEVWYFINNVRRDYHNYYLIRFFTGMRTSEIDGLNWKYVDMERREILIRETLVKGNVETTKTAGSARVIRMSEPVYEAFRNQKMVTGDKCKYVFCNKNGQPLNYSNVSARVWYPTLKKLEIEPRRPYQTRHTAATLWLAAGESPEWIARQMGHSTTKMLFTVYSRYVPNATRNDGSAFESLITGGYAASHQEESRQ
jgi:integrase